jgi:hypothetical protein
MAVDNLRLLREKTGGNGGVPYGVLTAVNGSTVDQSC